MLAALANLLILLPVCSPVCSMVTAKREISARRSRQGRTGTSTPFFIYFDVDQDHTRPLSDVRNLLEVTVVAC
jgi:hypothetical protein